MFFGMTPQVFGHTLISVVGIASGFVVAYGLLTAKRLDGWTSIFLWTTVMTSVTGFMLPADRILPSHIVGAISLFVLPIAFYARYSRRTADSWRVDLCSHWHDGSLSRCVRAGRGAPFLKVPALKPLAPTQAEPPFAIAQGVVFLTFVGLSTAAVKRFRGAHLQTA